MCQGSVILRQLYRFTVHKMEFLECVRLYANKPTNSLVNVQVNKSDAIDWNERLQTIRRLIGDQLSRLKIEESCLRNLTLENNQNRRLQSSIPISTIDPNHEDLFNQNRKRFCTIPSNSFDVDVINQTELDLDS